MSELDTMLPTSAQYISSEEQRSQILTQVVGLSARSGLHYTT